MICNALMALTRCSMLCNAAPNECGTTLLDISTKLDAAIVRMDLNAMNEICQHLDASKSVLSNILRLSVFLKPSIRYLSDELRLEAENLVQEVNTALADTAKINFDQENSRIEEMRQRISEDIQLGMFRSLF